MHRTYAHLRKSCLCTSALVWWQHSSFSWLQSTALHPASTVKSLLCFCISSCFQRSWCAAGVMSAVVFSFSSSFLPFLRNFPANLPTLTCISIQWMFRDGILLYQTFVKIFTSGTVSSWRWLVACYLVRWHLMTTASVFVRLYIQRIFYSSTIALCFVMA